MLEFERARVSLAGYRTPLSVLRTVPPPGPSVFSKLLSQPFLLSSLEVTLKPPPHRTISACLVCGPYVVIGVTRRRDKREKEKTPSDACGCTASCMSSQ